MKTIKYYRESQYGNWREYCADENESEGRLIRHLTGRKTLTEDIRQTISTLTNGAVSFEQVIAPLT